jgi:hypothetical protein
MTSPRMKYKVFKRLADVKGMVDKTVSEKRVRSLVESRAARKPRAPHSTRNLTRASTRRTAGFFDVTMTAEASSTKFTRGSVNTRSHQSVGVTPVGRASMLNQTTLLPGQQRYSSMIRHMDPDDRQKVFDEELWVHVATMDVPRTRRKAHN